VSINGAVQALRFNATVLIAFVCLALASCDVLRRMTFNSCQSFTGGSRCLASQR